MSDAKDVAEPLSLAGLSVLVVEDDALLRKQIRSVLEAQGVEVDEAGTLRQARLILEQLPPDFILLDLNLPDGYGLDLLGEREIGQCAVIVITGQGGVRSAVEAMKRGASDYLAKPFELEEIVLALRRVLRERRQQRHHEHESERAL